MNKTHPFIIIEFSSLNSECKKIPVKKHFPLKVSSRNVNQNFNGDIKHRPLKTKKKQ